MDETKLQDLAITDLAAVGRELLWSQRWETGVLVFCRAIPNAAQRVRALERLVKAIEAMEGGTLALRAYPAAAVQAWLAAPGRSSVEVSAAFREAMGSSADA